MPGFPSEGNRTLVERVQAQITSAVIVEDIRQEDEVVQSTQEMLFDFQNQERRMTVWHRGKIPAADISLS